MNFDSVEQLRGHFLFSPLNDKQFERLSPFIKRFELAAEGHLFRVGDTATDFFLLCGGQMQLYLSSANGEEKVIEIIQPGQTFAEAIMFFRTPVYPVSSRAVLDSSLWRIDMQAFRQILQESNELCLHLLGNMSRRLHNAIQDIEQLSLHNATIRVIQFLLASMPENGSLNYRLQWETPKQILASKLSMRPETFSRILQQLSRNGLIRVEGKTVEVVDAGRLRREMGDASCLRIAC